MTEEIDKKCTCVLGQVQWMFIENQQLYNSVDSLLEKSYLWNV